MAALPEDFLKVVVAESAALKGIKDATGSVKENDATIRACAKIAYAQVCKACRRPFHYGYRVQMFDEYYGPLLLRTIPVDFEKPIQVVVDGETIPFTDWKVTRNRLVLYGYTDTDPTDVLYRNIEFFSTCGIRLLDENNTLLNAVQLQTIGNYHRRDSLGLAEFSGEKGVAKTPADSGELLESARQLLDDLIYNGHGYSLDGE